MSEESTRNRILSAAGPIFAEKGFAKATVRDICAAADVNLASINYYFGDKEKLYIETVRYARSIRVSAAPMPEWEPGTPPEQKLRDFIATLLARMLGLGDDSWDGFLLMREIMRPSEACRVLVKDYFRPHFQQLLDIVDGFVPADTPLFKREQICFSIVGQCFFYRSSSEIIPLIIGKEQVDRHYQIADLAEHITDFCLAALAKSQSRDASSIEATVSEASDLPIGHDT